MIKKLLDKYLPGRGQVIDAVTAKPIQDVGRSVAVSRILAVFTFLFALAVVLAPVLRRTLGLFLVVAAAVLFLAASTGQLFAQTDMTAAVDTMSSLWTAIETMAIGVVIFVVGRKLFRKI